MEKNTLQKNNVLEIKDLSLVAYLFSLKEISFMGKRKLPNGTVVFLFSPSDKAEQLISLYWALEAPPIQPKQLFSAQRDIKDMIFSG